ncbi:MAG TPA: hypothetical protein VJ227_00385 [Patescibacteria group bacterium]|nr:hypothetical protein [Patescibacteria group bacterium]
MNWVKRFKALPVKTKKLLGLGIVLALVAALPLFIWAIVTQRFLVFKRAATGEPTPSPTSTVTPTPVPTTPPGGLTCGGTCGTNSNCASGLVCYQGYCRSPSCASDTDCVCTVSSSPPPTVRPFKILFKMRGVSGDEATYAQLGEQYAKVVVRFASQALNYYLGYTTSPIGVTYEGSGIYSLYFGVWSADLPPGQDYSIYLKGDKHLATRFCLPVDQSLHCSFGQISIPVNPQTLVELDFTGIPLEPGDLYPQDGAVTTLGANSDLAALLSLLAKPPASLTVQDLLTGDLDYNGTVNIRDLFLLRQTLQTKYDDN